MASDETTLKVGDRTVTVRLKPTEAYQPNPDNSNAGSERGDKAIRDSLGQVGFHRGIVTSADGVVIAGNHAYAASVEEGIVKGWIEIETEGDIGVVTKRKDWESAQDPKAIAAGLYDNRTQQLNFRLNTEQFAFDLSTLEAANLEIPKSLYNPADIESAFTAMEEMQQQGEGMGRRGAQQEGDRFVVPIFLTREQRDRWDQIKEAMGETKDTAAFLKLAEMD